MDGHASNGASGTQPSREPAHSHHRSSSFVTTPYTSLAVGQLSCAAAGSSSHLNESIHARTSYSISSSSLHSPSRLAGATSAAISAPPPPRSSDVRHQVATTSSYSASYPAANFAIPHSSSTTSYNETQKSSAPEPPKKPLSPYMRFSKSVSSTNWAFKANTMFLVWSV